MQQRLDKSVQTFQNTKDDREFIYSFWSGHFWVMFRSTHNNKVDKKGPTG